MRRLALLVLGVSVVVGLVVAAASVAVGTGMCLGPLGSEDCHALVRTLAVRTGLVAGLVTAVMLFLVVGLLRMVEQDDRRREIRRAEREGGAPAALE